ncbi:MAG TPA: hypothetical protein VGL77_02825 [Armatimonadota bacterium]|jgi:hypothetical protein
MKNPTPNLIMHLHLLWEPWKSDPAAVEAAVKDIKSLGFNTVNMEAKPWEDFFRYYADGTENDYVQSVKRVISSCQAHGMQHAWMGFWVFGENLDKNGITDMHVRMGEVCQTPPGSEDDYDDRQYKLWSPNMLDTLVAHHRGLTQCFPDNTMNLRADRPSRLVQGCELAPRPSFDADGIARYQRWLQAHYQGNIAEFNARYGTAYTDFMAIAPDDYWANYRSEEPNTHIAWRHWHPDTSQFLAGGVLMQRWADNAQWKMEESERFAEAMQARYDAQGLGIAFWPIVDQWKLLLQDAGFAWWWHCDKANDPWRMTKHFLEVGAMTLPCDVYHQSSAAALETELALQRSINRFEPFTGAVFLGRHMHGDIYTSVTPSQTIATFVAAGAQGLNIYGYNGLDDGGAFCQLSWDWRESLRTGLAWYKAVYPQMAGMPQGNTAILLPLATMMLEPVDSMDEQYNTTMQQRHAIHPIPPKAPLVDFPAHRQDVLGWFQMLRDGQYGVEVLHPMHISGGRLDDFAALIIPWSPAYRWMPDPEMEAAIVAWVARGGVLVCGPDDTMLPAALRTAQVEHPRQIIDTGEPLIPEGEQIVAFPELTPLAKFRESGQTAIGVMTYGQGTVIRFAFHAGAAFAHPFVEAVSVGGDAVFFPLNMLKQNYLARLLQAHGVQPLWQDDSGIWWKGIEVTRFDNGYVVINTTHSSWPLPEAWQNTGISLLGGDGRRLLPHDALWVPDTQ